jgi:hypothetical protein
MFEDLDLTEIHEENARELIKRLLNLVEQLNTDLRSSQAEVQRLRDEVNRLKGPSARQTQCQGEYFEAACHESLFREGTAYSATSPQKQEENGNQNRSGTSGGSRSFEIASGCQVQGV